MKPGDRTVAEDDIDDDARVTTEMTPVPKDEREEPLEPSKEQPGR